MRYINYIIGLLIMSVAFISCSLNEMPVFNDADAYVAFEKGSYIVDENSGTLSIAVTQVALKGKSNTVYYTITEGSAKEGVHYRDMGNGTLNYSEEVSTAYIQLEIIDNDVFGGDVNLSIDLVDAGVLTLGSESTCNILIADDEHPLSAILGEWAASGSSDFGGTDAWNIQFLKDDDDISKVWFRNLVNGVSNLDVYGLVNEDMTEIHIPVGQEIHEHSSYDEVILSGYYGADKSNIPTGGFITMKISEDKSSIAVEDYFGSYVIDGGVGLGWFERYSTDVVLVR